MNKKLDPPKKIFKPKSAGIRFENLLLSIFFSLAYFFLVLLYLFIVIMLFVRFQNKIFPQARDTTLKDSITYKTPELPKFDSCQVLYGKLKESSPRGRGVMLDGMMQFGAPAAVSPMGMAKSFSGDKGGFEPDYSQTNIQVTGVDEADIVKTDGRYIYTLSKGYLTVSLAYPAQNSKLLSKVKINGSPQELFIDGNNIMIFGSRNIRYRNEIDTSSQRIKSGAMMQEMSIYPNFRTFTFVDIYNVSDPSIPKIKRSLEFDGNYLSSRMIDNYVYFVLNSYPDYRIFDRPLPLEDYSGITPMYQDNTRPSSDISEPKFRPVAPCVDVTYIEPIVTNQYLTIIGLPIDSYSKPITTKVILGASQNIYASLENLYVANTIFKPDTWQSDVMGGPGEEATEVFKFKLQKDEIPLEVSSAVPGRILNQFSMDEYNNYFRIATTIGHVSRQGGGSSNNVYILDTNLQIVGSVEDIAPGEQIYSARFMGPKGYLVTFKKVDPFFTLDLSNPRAPKILGKLKIPGYSDYLHPYDENHIIGIGKETIEAEEGNFAWYQGIKMALFDVTDFSNPKEISKVVIGDRGTDSPILNDHKALLFSREKNLLVIPITLAEIPNEQKAQAGSRASAYGNFVYQGSYVYRVSPDKGFTLVGRITHYDDAEIFKKSGYYFGYGDATIKRNLYIDNNLYSISDNKILIHDLDNLLKQGEILFNTPNTEQDIPYY